MGIAREMPGVDGKRASFEDKPCQWPPISARLSSPNGFDVPIQFVQSSLGNIPLRRPGTADDAKAVLFLASDDSSYITGIELFVDAAWLRYNPRNARNAQCDSKRSLEKNVEAYGERDAGKRRTAISMMWETYIA